MHHADGRVVSNFIVQALKGEPITVFGSGEQTRSFCYIDDLVGGLIALMATGPQVTGPVNLGNPSEFTIRALAEKVVAMTGSGVPIEARPLPSDDPRQRKPDIAKARDLLGWEPSVPLDAGLARTIAFFRGRLQELGLGREHQVAEGRSPERRD
jgi:UDP-glucuronate decarboxylase